MSVGVVVVGHGSSATALLDAARGVVGDAAVADFVAVDAGLGEGPAGLLSSELCQVIEDVDEGGGVVMLVDLLGASPCQCAQQQGEGHEVVLVSGLNLAMLLKMASLDRSAQTPAALAEACQDSGRRAVTSRAVGKPAGQTPNTEVG